ncbi:hypothetical protein GCM10011571_24200 [Marinithermofilum abyssi]|uniref:Uncharacterized protein n=1 Tax=Marinithermofilum abyssi TaxID=1571185 RepID=A0A8J2VI84_9BACL|nr:hypothetical protein GCM10011571_24200 [Marinithermofilum abyssi]
MTNKKVRLLIRFCFIYRVLCIHKTLKKGVEIDIGSAIKRETMHEAAYKRLKTAILSDKLSTGVYYTENEFADALNISRTPTDGCTSNLKTGGSQYEVCGVSDGCRRRGSGTKPPQSESLVR